MYNLNEFNQLVQTYTGKKSTVKESKNVIIDCRPNAIVGEMLLTKPKNEEERDDCISAMIAGIAEAVAPDVAISIEDIAAHIAYHVGTAIGELYAADEDGDW